MRECGWTTRLSDKARCKAQWLFPALIMSLSLSLHETKTMEIDYLLVSTLLPRVNLPSSMLGKGPSSVAKAPQKLYKQKEQRDILSERVRLIANYIVIQQDSCRQHQNAKWLRTTP